MLKAENLKVKILGSITEQESYSLQNKCVLYYWSKTLCLGFPPVVQQPQLPQDDSRQKQDGLQELRSPPVEPKEMQNQELSK